MIKVFLVDDHRLLRSGLKKFVATQEGMEVVAEFSQAQEVLSEIPRYNPQVVICDINLPDENGIDLTLQIKERYPAVKVIILSMHKSRSYILEAVKAKVDGYLHKDIFEKELTEAILKVCRGEKYFSKEISQVIIDNLYQQEEEAMLFDLTSRESEVLKFITDGYTNREIADKLFISTKTVDKHRANLLHKLNARNTAELVKYAVQKNLI